ncbi:hypothetical protein [Winogradskya consettensis]|nr:hypothetical protein [Actinoplanes consettensis]
MSGGPQEPQPEQSERWPQPISAGHWTDTDGVRWHLRGRRIDQPGPPLRRLLKRPGLRVLHAYGPDPLEVTGSSRDALLERVHRFFAGEAPPHSAFWLAEFRNDDHQAMLIIEEGC